MTCKTVYENLVKKKKTLTFRWPLFMKNRIHRWILIENGVGKHEQNFRLKVGHINVQSWIYNKVGCVMKTKVILNMCVQNDMTFSQCSQKGIVHHSPHPNHWHIIYRSSGESSYNQNKPIMDRLLVLFEISSLSLVFRQKYTIAINFWRK